MTENLIDKAVDGRVGHAVLLGIDNEAHRLLVECLKGRIALRRFGSPEELFVAMEHSGLNADAMVLGVRLEQPVRIVQRIHGFGLDIPVLVITEPSRNEQLSQALRFAPFIGNDVKSWCSGSLETLPQVLSEAVNRTRKRRQFKGSIDAAQRRLGKLPGDRPQITHYFERLLDRAPIGVLNLDVRGTILSLNRYACQVLEVNERAVLGTAVTDFLPEEEHRRLRDIIARCVAPMSKRVPEILAVRSTRGMPRYAEVIASSLVDRTGQLGATLILQDVTDRVRAERRRQHAEEALRSSEERYRELIQMMNEALAMTDQDYHITFVNQSFCDMFGYSVNEVLGRPLLDLVHPDDEVMMAERVAARNECPTQRFETAWLARDGRTIYTLTSPRTFVDTEGRFAGCLGVLTDITERKRIEQWDRARLQELAHVSRVTTIGEMSSQIAHELAQPLTAIGAMSTALLKLLKADAATQDDIRETLSEISMQSGRAREIIIRLRDFVRNEEVRHIPIDINDLIRTVVRLAEPEVRHRSLEMLLELAPSLPQTNGDRILIEQVLLNLVRNAIEAMVGDGGKVHRLTIRSAADGSDWQEVSVSDTGPGLSAEIKSKIFEPFFTTKADGMGMGLAITRSIIEAHGGQLRVECNPTGGASFRFSLPVVATDREVEP